MTIYDSISSLYEKKLLVYGMGSIARILLPYLFAMPDRIHLIGIALTHVDQKEQYLTTGLNIHSIHQWAEECPEAVVLIATSDTYHREITEICQREGFKDIVPITPNLKDSITCTFFERYLAEKNVDLSGHYIQLGNTKFLNPLKINLRNSANIFAQLSDIVFPHLFQDWTLLDEGPYDPDGVFELTAGSTVLDCGANFGTFSAYAASKGCKCYAFEPTPELQPVLREYADLYPGKIILVKSALSNQNGTATFHLSGYSCGANSLLDRVQTNESILVSTVTVDSFVEQNQLDTVDFIKADIEGAERMMLEGAQGTLAKYAPKLSLCTYHFPDDKEVLTELILKANPKYKIEYHWEKLYAYVPQTL